MIVLSALVFCALIFLSSYNEFVLLERTISSFPRIVEERGRILGERAESVADDCDVRAELAVLLYGEYAGFPRSERLELVRDAVSARSVTLAGPRRLRYRLWLRHPAWNALLCPVAVLSRAGRHGSARASCAELPVLHDAQRRLAVRFLASAGIVSIAIGMGAKDLIADILAGLFLIFEGSVHVGDAVTVGSWSGTVTDMGIRTMEIANDAGDVKIISNARISEIVNRSRNKGNGDCFP